MLTGRVHNPESGMTSALFRFIKWLLETNDGKAASRDYLFLIIPFTIPLTFAEDPRAHNVNRCWFPEMTEPDLLAIRNKVLDRYLPEIWIDLHSFNEVLPLEKPEEKRKRRGDYIVAHPVNECWFDRFFSKEIAREAILAAESAGHEHRNREFFDEWVKKFSNGPYATPNENIITEHDPIGIFSGKDYARYADRGKYGPEGRNWPAMACDYGYYRCHSLNLCFECKPLHVKREDRTYHYSPGFPDSHLVKLKKLCELGKNSFSGQPTSGFPCNLIASDTDDNENSAILCAWGNDREKLRTSRKKLWQNRRAAVVRKFEGKDGKLTVSVHWFCSETVDSVIRLPFANKGKVPEIYTEKHKCRNAFLKDKFLFIPLKLLPGNNHITLK
jgi:hypothetical protein